MKEDGQIIIILTIIGMRIANDNPNNYVIYEVILHYELRALKDY